MDMTFNLRIELSTKHHVITQYKVYIYYDQKKCICIDGEGKLTHPFERPEIYPSEKNGNTVIQLSIYNESIDTQVSFTWKKYIYIAVYGFIPTLKPLAKMW